MDSIITLNEPKDWMRVNNENLNGFLQNYNLENIANKMGIFSNINDNLRCQFANDDESYTGLKSLIVNNIENDTKVVALESDYGIEECLYLQNYEGSDEIYDDLYDIWEENENRALLDSIVRMYDSSEASGMVEVFTVKMTLKSYLDIKFA